MTSKERKEARYRRRIEMRLKRKRDRVKGCDTLEQLIDFDNFIKSYFECQKGVAWKHSVQSYRIHLFENIYASITLIIKGKSVVKGFVEFEINERGKRRHIMSVHISERVIQKLCCMFFLVKAIDPTLIYDNSASTKGGGTHKCLRRLRCHLQRFYKKNGNNKGYIAILDIKSFFDNIRHIDIYKKLKLICEDKRILELIMQFVDAFNPLFYKRTSNKKLNKIQKFKRRMNGKSLGLGSEVSQTFAKSHVNEIDHFMKEVLHIKFYAHYMDDFYIISENKAFVEKAVNIFETKLAELGLKLNESKCKIYKLRDTFTFLKVRFNLLESGKVLRRVSRKSITRMRRKLKKLKVMLDEGKITFETVRTSYESFKGYIGQPSGKKHRHKHKIFKLQSRNCKRNMDKLFNKLFIEDWHYIPQM